MTIPQNKTYEEASASRPMKPYEMMVDDVKYIFFLPGDDEPTGDDFCLYKAASSYDEAHQALLTGEGITPVVWLGNGPEYKDIATLLDDISTGNITYDPGAAMAPVEQNATD